MASTTRQLWVLVSFQQSHDGTPQFVGKSTDHGGNECLANWCDSPREAHQFNSGRSARRFLAHLDEYGIFPLNLGPLGFAG